MNAISFHRKEAIVFSMLLFLFVLSSIALAQKRTIPQTPLFVEVNGNLLTLRSMNMPLKDVLREIGKKASFKVTFHAPADELLTIEFAGLPIERGLKLITKGINTALVYGPQDKNDRLTGIRELIIYPTSQHYLKGSAPRAPAPVKGPHSSLQPAPPPPSSRPDPETTVHGLQSENPAEVPSEEAGTGKGTESREKDED